MSYIGRQNLGGAYRQLDDISSGFDGSDTTHTMQVNSQNVTVGDVNQIILSLGGVIQKPGTDFTVSGSVLTFTTAPAANTSFFAILLGSDNGGTVTPTDGSVTGDKIASNAAITTTGAANFNGGITMGGTTPTLTIGDAGAEDTKIVFDGNAQDFYIGLDDSADDLIIGVGSAVGTTPAISITDGRVVTIGASGIPVDVGGITFYEGQSGSIYTADVSGTDDSAENNTAYGASAMDAITTGDNNTAMGEHALGALNTGVDNVAIGYNAGSSMTSASYSTVVGRNAGASMVDSRLTAIGYYAGGATTHIGNTFVGFNTGAANTSGTYNVAMGYNALYQPDTESNNIAIGSSALSAVVAGGEANTAVGTNALDALTSGDENVAVGQHAGTAHTTGVDCIYIGESCGGSNTTGSYKTLIGCNADTNGNSDAHEIVIGYNLTGGGQNKVRLGSGSNYIENDYANNANWAHSSDERLKDNIQTDNLGLDFINELRTVTYNWKASDKVDTSLPGYMHPDTTDFDKLSKDTSVTMNGLIAQEVKAALDKVGADASKYAVWSTDDDGIQRISESSFVMPLIKAVQELSAKVKALEDA